MIFNRLHLFLRQCYKGSTWNCRFCSAASTAASEKDPMVLFFNERVQELLIKLTRLDYEKIFAPRKDGTPLTTPTYKFMTDEELERAKAQVEKKAKSRIQMPPVVNMRPDTVQVLSEDFGIQGFSDSNFVFTDISFGGTNKNRLIVVREPTGVLRHANCNERHRMNQVYFPVKGREIDTPKMFHDPYFSNLLEEEKFTFILDRACLQFEPDDPEYHRITKTVYSRVNEWKKFDALRSTRHFGPMVFHLVLENNFGALLEDVIKNEKIEEGAALIELYHYLHPEAPSAGTATRNDLELIRYYASTVSSNRYNIERLLDTYELLLEERKKVEEGIKKAHGYEEETGADEPKA